MYERYRKGLQSYLKLKWFDPTVLEGSKAKGFSSSSSFFLLSFSGFLENSLKMGIISLKLS